MGDSQSFCLLGTQRQGEDSSFNNKSQDSILRKPGKFWEKLRIFAACNLNRFLVVDRQPQYLVSIAN